MNKRFYISTGRNGDGSTNYGVQDSQPATGSDGRRSDHRDRTEAQARCNALNAAFAAEVRSKAAHGLEWRYNGRCYSWDVPPRAYNPYD